MATRAFSYANEPWSHDWEYEIVGHFGDVDHDPTYGAVVTIIAGSPVQAEQRALTFLIACFDDPVNGLVEAAADSEPVAEKPLPRPYCLARPPMNWALVSPLTPT